MKLPLIKVGVISAVLISGCSQQSPAASTTDYTIAPTPLASSIAYEDMPPIPASSVTLQCSSYSPDAQAYVRQEADLMVNDVQYRIATVACGEPNSELSAEVVESYVADSGVWASNGLVSGSDVPFNTSGPCESDNTVVTCPAYVMGEEGEAIGYIEITGQDNGLVWTFIAEDEVAL
jgi:hypothetical protein